ncbi:hypothetical protein P7C73_g913, partial [Tremellales sp. Uapishka_1]
MRDHIFPPDVTPEEPHRIAKSVRFGGSSEKRELEQVFSFVTEKEHQPRPIHPHPVPPRRLISRFSLPIIVLLVQLWIVVFRRPLTAPVPSLSPTFLSECNALLFPTPTTFSSRLSRLSTILAASDSVFVAEPGPTAQYFVGSFASSDWWLSERPFLISIASEGDIVFLVPGFERLRASLIAVPEEIKNQTRFLEWKESDDPYAILREYYGGRGKRVVVDSMVRSFIAEGLEGQFEKGDAEDLARIKLIRERKDEREIGLLRCANQMTLHAIRKTKARMNFGITEAQTREILEEEMVEAGLTGGDGLVLFGENAALPHGSGTDRKLGKEDFVLIDAGGKFGGYVSDITRTFALSKSKIPKAHLEIWETVRLAQHAPFDLLLSSRFSHPPMLGELDASARDLVNAKYNASDFEIFTHRLGHGIGLEGHEGPYVVQGPLGQKQVEIGHVFSLEPGIYLPGQRGKGVGVRLEDCFVVRKEGDHLSGEWLSGPVRAWGDI